MNTKTKTKTIGATDLLIKDHNEVKAMFKKYEELSDRSTATKKKLADQICHALTLHTELEEEIFYPTVREEIDDDELMDEALVEHTAAKQLIERIRKIDPEDDVDFYDAQIKVLSEQIEHHVAEEEKKMFPKVRKTEIDLFSLGEEMLEFKEQREKEGNGNIKR